MCGTLLRSRLRRAELIWCPSAVADAEIARPRGSRAERVENGLTHVVVHQPGPVRGLVHEKTTEPPHEARVVVVRVRRRREREDHALTFAGARGATPAAAGARGAGDADLGAAARTCGGRQHKDRSLPLRRRDAKSPHPAVEEATEIACVVTGAVDDPVVGHGPSSAGCGRAPVGVRACVEACASSSELPSCGSSAPDGGCSSERERSSGDDARRRSSSSASSGACSFASAGGGRRSREGWRGVPCDASCGASFPSCAYARAGGQNTGRSASAKCCGARSSFVE